jgi:hypothetical protein
MNKHAHVGAVPGCPTELFERAVVLSPGVRVAAGVELDRGYTKILCAVESSQIRIDEQAHSGSRLIQLANGLAEPGIRSAQIQTPLGGDLLPALGDECGLIGAEPAGKSNDIWTGGELEIEDRDFGPQAFDVAVLNMPPVLTQVSSDPVGTRLLAEQGGFQRVRLISLPGFPEGGHVIDVDVQPHRRHCPPLP